MYSLGWAIVGAIADEQLVVLVGEPGVEGEDEVGILGGDALEVDLRRPAERRRRLGAERLELVGSPRPHRAGVLAEPLRRRHRERRRGRAGRPARAARRRRCARGTPRRWSRRTCGRSSPGTPIRRPRPAPSSPAWWCRSSPTPGRTPAREATVMLIVARSAKRRGFIRVTLQPSVRSPTSRPAGSRPHAETFLTHMAPRNRVDDATASIRGEDLGAEARRGRHVPTRRSASRASRLRRTLGRGRSRREP